MFTVLGIAIPAGLILVGAKYVPSIIDELKKKTKSSESSQDQSK